MKVNMAFKKDARLSALLDFATLCAIIPTQR